MTQQIDTKELLAVAFTAYRVNDGFVRDTRRFSESENDTKFSNKEMLKYHYAKDPSWLPEDWKAIVVNQEDRQNAIDAVKFLNKEFSLQMIAGTINDFIKSLLSKANSQECTQGDIGVLCLLPKVYFETKSSKESKKHIKSTFGESRHISSIGGKIEGKFVVNSIRFVEKFGCHILSGHIDNNLVSFFKEFGPGKETPKVNDVLNIKAKVKKHGENYETKIPETLVNYVRFV